MVVLTDEVITRLCEAGEDPAAVLAALNLTTEEIFSKKKD